MADGSAAIPTARNLHILFIPFLARSHCMTLVDTAILFARRGASCTVVTTPGNSSYIRGTIEKEGLPIDLRLVPFPAAEAGLPAGIECTDALPGPGDFPKLYSGMQLLARPIEELIIDRRPDVLVFDIFLHWFADVACSNSVPYFLFDTMSPLHKAIFESLYYPTGILDEELLTVPLTGLPFPLEFFRSELPSGCLSGLIENLTKTERRSCGVLSNCFEELTPGYQDYCATMTASGSALKLWCIGPVQLCRAPSRDDDDDGNKNWDRIKRWLDSKRPDSVLYVSFGSECFFSSEQLREIAVGLRDCEHPFIWVVRGNGGGAETMDEWLPEEYLCTEERGMILTEWAPQAAILNHPATGGFLTHCGWRSTVEALCTGQPVIPWPLHSEQFTNERILVDVLKVGLRILEGPRMRTLDAEGKELVRAGLIRDAVNLLLGGGDEKVRAMRQSAKRYKEVASSVMVEGGSSYVNLSRVMEQMNMLAKK